MGFFKTIKSFFAGGDGQSDQYWIYVRCYRCGEVIKTRTNLQEALTLHDDGGYVMHKTLVGNQLCFQRIEVTLMFDQHRRLVDREIVHGDFITSQEYELKYSELGGMDG